jgi:hypothetical protein
LGEGVERGALLQQLALDRLNLNFVDFYLTRDQPLPRALLMTVLVLSVTDVRTTTIVSDQVHVGGCLIGEWCLLCM